MEVVVCRVRIGCGKLILEILNSSEVKAVQCMVAHETTKWIVDSGCFQAAERDIGLIDEVADVGFFLRGRQIGQLTEQGLNDSAPTIKLIK